MPDSAEGWRDEEIVLVDADDRWPALFEDEANRLREIIGPWVTGGIHHVGSTAVPGLAAKPIIDILAGVESLAASWPCIDLLAPLRYLYAPYRTEEMHWLCKPDPAHRTHHLHLVPTGSARFEAELAFRDHLRARRARSHEYEDLKRELAVRHRHDREAYTAAKADFIAQTLARIPVVTTPTVEESGGRPS